MRDESGRRRDRMGRLNNKLVAVIDESDVSVLEAIIVLRMMADRLEKLFIATTSLRGKKSDAGNVEKAGVRG